MAYVQEIFPTRIYMNICDRDIEDAVEFLRTVDIADTEEEVIANYGYRSRDAYILNRPECASLRDWLEDCLNEYATEVVGLEVEGMGITQSWVTIKHPGQKHIAHKHPNSVISAAFYFDEGGEPITFYETNNDYFKVKRNPEKAPFNTYTLLPKKYGVVLFPSHLEHEVSINTSKEPRYSLSFNSLPLGSFGSDGDLTHIDYSRIIGKKLTEYNGN
jgi:uncharacterized protein (TIGR02466 family)